MPIGRLATSRCPWYEWVCEGVFAWVLCDGMASHPGCIFSSLPGIGVGSSATLTRTRLLKWTFIPWKQTASTSSYIPCNKWDVFLTPANTACLLNGANLVEMNSLNCLLVHLHFFKNSFYCKMSRNTNPPSGIYTISGNCSQIMNQTIAHFVSLLHTIRIALKSATHPALVSFKALNATEGEKCI